MTSNAITLTVGLLLLVLLSASIYGILNNRKKGSSTVEPKFIQIDEDKYLEHFRNAATGNPKDAKRFFRRLPYNVYYNEKDYLNTFNSAIDSLTRLKSLDAQSYKDIHKGHIFYFTAISAFMVHDFQAATFFFDATAAEDMKNDPGERTPGLLFMVLDGQNPNQAAQELTDKAEKWLKTMIEEYNKVAGSVNLTIGEIRQLFLEKAITNHQEWRTLVTTWITYLLEWSHRFHILNLRMESGTWEPFYLHLFKGCLLFESLLKSEPTGQVSDLSLGKILATNSYARTKLGISGDITTQSAPLSDILSKSNKKPACLENDIEVVVKLRNTIGHNLDWVTGISLSEYGALANKVSNSCLHAISTLYR